MFASESSPKTSASYPLNHQGPQVEALPIDAIRRFSLPEVYYIHGTLLKRSLKYLEFMHSRFTDARRPDLLTVIQEKRAMLDTLCDQWPTDRRAVSTLRETARMLFHVVGVDQVFPDLPNHIPTLARKRWWSVLRSQLLEGESFSQRFIRQAATDLDVGPPALLAMHRQMVDRHLESLTAELSGKRRF